MENKTNKIIEHIANKKGIYGGLIGLLGLFGVVMLVNPFTSPDGGNLTGNVEELFNDDGALVILTPGEDNKFAEGDNIELTWEYSEAVEETTYRILAQAPNEEASVIESGISGNSYAFDLPYDAVTPEEGTKTFMLQISVEQTGDVYAGPQIITVNKAPLTITQPAQEMQIKEGGSMVIAWNYVDHVATTTYRVFVQPADDPEAESIVIAESIGETSTDLEVPYDGVSAEEGAKAFVLSVAVNGSDIVATTQVTLEHQDQFYITTPTKSELVEVTAGESFLVEWQTTQEMESEPVSVYLENLNTNQDVLVGEAQNLSFLEVQLPEDFPKNIQHKVKLKTADQLVEGGRIEWVNKQVELNLDNFNPEDELQNIQIDPDFLEEDELQNAQLIDLDEEDEQELELDLNTQNKNEDDGVSDTLDFANDPLRAVPGMQLLNN